MRLHEIRDVRVGVVADHEGKTLLRDRIKRKGKNDKEYCEAMHACALETVDPK